MSEDANPKSWWQTVPGILTAIAAIISAATALVAALNQTGVFAHKDGAKPAVVAESVAATKSPEGTTAPSVLPSTATNAQATTVVLPPNARLDVGKLAYILVSAEAEPYAQNKLVLKLKVRMANNDRYDANFWSASFRVLEDGVLQAPTSELNEIVAGNTSKEAVITFVVAASSKKLELQMGKVGKGAPALLLSKSL